MTASYTKRQVRPSSVTRPSGTVGTTTCLLGPYVFQTILSRLETLTCCSIQAFEVGGEVFVHGNLIFAANTSLEYETGYSTLSVSENLNFANDTGLIINFDTDNLKYMRLDSWTNAAMHVFI